MAQTCKNHKISNFIQEIIVDTKLNMFYYGNFLLDVSFVESNDVKTFTVYFGSSIKKGEVFNQGREKVVRNIKTIEMVFKYNEDYINSLSQKQVNFVVMHGVLHFLFEHQNRISLGAFNRAIANVAQDMIVNHLILEYVNEDIIDIPKDVNGRNTAIFIPVEYKGEIIFELLYNYLSEKYDEKKNQDKDESDGNGGKNDDYGQYGQNPSPRGKGKIESYSLDKILQDIMDGGDGEYLDEFTSDEVTPDERESFIQDIKQQMKNRGYEKGNGMTELLEKLKPKKKDHLKEIKRSLDANIFGFVKNKTFTRPNRKGISGFKGYNKKGTLINVIMDVSGSMMGSFEKVLEYVFDNEIQINFIQADTQIQKIEKIKQRAELQKIQISGLGGTVLQPAVDYVVEEGDYNKYPTVILTDGYCDSLDLSRLKQKCVIVSCGTQVHILNKNKKVTQITIDSKTGY